MDLAWTFAGESCGKGIMLFAEFGSFSMALVVLVLFIGSIRTLQARNDNILTYAIGLPTWPIPAIAWCAHRIGQSS